ncbi:MAG: DUF4422 domain-containing protein [Treponema sp.]|jgi:hypothetical protein|nr:DUF4422 domain-containing protein [Treponema sp.]
MEKNDFYDKDSRIKILVCYNKPEPLPNGNIFLPIQSGKACSEFNLDIQSDDTSDNISNRNEMFGEYTAWYWAWKNIKNYYPNIEYIGLSHYRRYFAMDKKYKTKRKGIIHLSYIPVMQDYENLFINSLAKNDIILIKPEYFAYDIRTQYSYCHNSFDYLCIKEIVHEICPEYEKSFLYFFERNAKISLYCMFVAKYDLFDNYFKWLFPLLFEAERRIDVSKYPKYQKRVLAFLAERLLNVYVYHHKLRIDYRPIFFIHDLDDKYREMDKIAKRVKRIIKMIIPYGIIIFMIRLRYMNGIQKHSVQNNKPILKRKG